MVSGLVACDENDDDENPFAEKEAILAPAVAQYVNNTVIATYKSLADASIELYDALHQLKENKSPENLMVATQIWIETRRHWERSEAFLYGPATDFGIDPHIDTWPLDETAFNNTITTPGSINSMDKEDGDIWAGEFLGRSLLGFHGIEYILFKEGNPKAVSEITADKLIYAVAVAGDLRNQCDRLYQSWADEDKETGKAYGENMLNAGKPGSNYKTITDAAVAIIEGCLNISAEVGEVKIGTAYSKDDVNYIESPYSYNSKVDFIDNIKSIENAYLGGADANKRGESVSDYIKSVNPTVDTAVKNAIKEAIAKIDAIPYPFALNYASPKAGEAMDACAGLTSALTTAKGVLEK
jgi:predicted lipoprotein